MKTKNINKVKEGDLLLAQWGKVYKVEWIQINIGELPTLMCSLVCDKESIDEQMALHPYEVIAKINKIDFEF